MARAFHHPSIKATDGGGIIFAVHPAFHSATLGNGNRTEGAASFCGIVRRITSAERVPRSESASPLGVLLPDGQRTRRQ